MKNDFLCLSDSVQGIMLIIIGLILLFHTLGVLQTFLGILLVLISIYIIILGLIKIIGPSTIKKLIAKKEKAPKE